jgi:hypothetical protein|eukprot:SAG25_NODE_20_length_23237_cov_58.179229_15_plen_166_part_00
MQVQPEHRTSAAEAVRSACFKERGEATADGSGDEACPQPAVITPHGRAASTARKTEAERKRLVPVLSRKDFAYERKPLEEEQLRAIMLREILSYHCCSGGGDGTNEGDGSCASPDRTKFPSFNPLSPTFNSGSASSDVRRQMKELTLGALSLPPGAPRPIADPSS